MQDARDPYQSNQDQVIIKKQLGSRHLSYDDSQSHGNGGQCECEYKRNLHRPAEILIGMLEVAGRPRWNRCILA